MASMYTMLPFLCKNDTCMCLYMDKMFLEKYLKSLPWNAWAAVGRGARKAET